MSLPGNHEMTMKSADSKTETKGMGIAITVLKVSAGFFSTASEPKNS
jgi:hypothetical protein